MQRLPVGLLQDNNEGRGLLSHLAGVSSRTPTTLPTVIFSLALIHIRSLQRQIRLLNKSEKDAEMQRTKRKEAIYPFLYSKYALGTALGSAEAESFINHWLPCQSQPHLLFKSKNCSLVSTHLIIRLCALQQSEPESPFAYPSFPTAES